MLDISARENDSNLSLKFRPFFCTDITRLITHHYQHVRLALLLFAGFYLGEVKFPCSVLFHSSHSKMSLSDTSSSCASVTSDFAYIDIADDSEDSDDIEIIFDKEVQAPLRNPFRQMQPRATAIGMEADPDEIIAETSGFEEFGFCEEILDGLRAAKLRQPYDTQAQAIRRALEKRDILCQTPSKSGKTAVFVLATLEHVSRRMDERKISASPSVLVVVPTRELADQIYNEYRRLGSGFAGPNAVNRPIRVLRVIGGLARSDDEERLTLRSNSVIDIVVGTPGRILDLVNSKMLKVNRVQHFVVDEVQRSLTEPDMRGDIQDIFLQTPPEKQVMLFATPLTAEAVDIARKFLDNEFTVRAESFRRNRTAFHQHRHLHQIEDHKPGCLLELLPWLQNRFAGNLARVEPVQIVIFTDTIERTSELTLFLRKYASQYEVLELDSSLSQHLRLHNFSRMQQNKCPILVATELAARGLNIPNVAVVINFDAPRTVLDYHDRSRVIGQNVEQSLVISLCRYASEAEELMKNGELKRYKGAFEYSACTMGSHPGGRRISPDFPSQRPYVDFAADDYSAHDQSPSEGNFYHGQNYSPQYQQHQGYHDSYPDNRWNPQGKPQQSGPPQQFHQLHPGPPQTFQPQQFQQQPPQTFAYHYDDYPRHESGSGSSGYHTPEATHWKDCRSGPSSGSGPDRYATNYQSQLNQQQAGPSHQQQAGPSRQQQAGPLRQQQWSPASAPPSHSINPPVAPPVGGHHPPGWRPLGGGHPLPALTGSQSERLFYPFTQFIYTCGYCLKTLPNVPEGGLPDAAIWRAAHFDFGLDRDCLVRSNDSTTAPDVRTFFADPEPKPMDVVHAGVVREWAVCALCENTRTVESQSMRYHAGNFHKIEMAPASSAVFLPVSVPLQLLPPPPTATTLRPVVKRENCHINLHERSPQRSFSSTDGGKIAAASGSTESSSNPSLPAISISTGLIETPGLPVPASVPQSLGKAPLHPSSVVQPSLPPGTDESRIPPFSLSGDRATTNPDGKVNASALKAPVKSVAPSVSLPNTKPNDTPAPTVSIPSAKALPESSLSESPLPESLLPGSPLPGSPLPKSSLPESALPESALPESPLVPVWPFSVLVSGTSITGVEKQPAKLSSSSAVAGAFVTPGSVYPAPCPIFPSSAASRMDGKQLTDLMASASSVSAGSSSSHQMALPPNRLSTPVIPVAPTRILQAPVTGQLSSSTTAAPSSSSSQVTAHTLVHGSAAVKALATVVDGTTGNSDADSADHGISESQKNASAMGSGIACSLAASHVADEIPDPLTDPARSRQPSPETMEPIRIKMESPVDALIRQHDMATQHDQAFLFSSWFTSLDDSGATLRTTGQRKRKPTASVSPSRGAGKKAKNDQVARKCVRKKPAKSLPAPLSSNLLKRSLAAGKTPSLGSSDKKRGRGRPRLTDAEKQKRAKGKRNLLTNLTAELVPETASDSNGDQAVSREDSVPDRGPEESVPDRGLGVHLFVCACGESSETEKDWYAHYARHAFRPESIPQLRHRLFCPRRHCGYLAVDDLDFGRHCLVHYYHMKQARLQREQDVLMK
ncbi:putative ATP-dependent RNA helicase uap56 [Hypsibius exemplaris]|uniref:ATP-dependent RNA helicase n=1 Tax=Hypsibius exemplaris TaxID=2072580 RepID=A0A9X6NCV0_HYPEX|nr:putative ATP-dependent RNA helicase uap56 [Hypsibius exemplaris]